MIDISHNASDTSSESPLILNPTCFRQPNWRLAYRQIVGLQIAQNLSGTFPGEGLQYSALPAIRQHRKQL